MTAETIITSVLDDLERGDLIDVARRKFPLALKKAHGVIRSGRDLRLHYFTDLIPVEGIVNLDLRDFTVPHREILGMKSYLSYTEPTVGVIIPTGPLDNTDNDYVSLSKPTHSRHVMDYYGFSYEKNYIKVGNFINVSGVPANATVMEMCVLSDPYVELDPVELLFETDSWIVTEFPELVEVFLIQEIYKTIPDNSREKEFINDRRETIYNFQARYVEDVLGR